MIKATREAKVHTRWTTPNEAHESALRDFVAGVLDRKSNAEFCSKFEQFQHFTALYGMMNGLSQTLLKTTCPGVPDCYQGSELWDLRLVDPDNRGTIDFDKRRELAASSRERMNRRMGRISKGARIVEGRAGKDARPEPHFERQKGKPRFVS